MKYCCDSYKHLKYEVEDKILTITFNRPDKMNAYTEAMGVEIRDALNRADNDDHIRVIVFTGEGKGFCAGMDLSDVNSFDYSNIAFDEHRDGGGMVALKIYEMSKPTIAAINGVAVGVGITMTLPMDIRIASTNAKMGFVFSRRGIVTESCSSYFLPRVVGISKSLEWAITGRIFCAREALESGLVSKIVEPEELMETVYDISREIANYTAPVSVSLIRRLLWRNLNVNDVMDTHEMESEILHWIGQQPDAAEGGRSFMEKRSPEFTMSPLKDVPPVYPWRPTRPFRQQP